ncbi:peptidylprolyl isomerase [Pseudazoarcus pumilus]|uniref:Peptidyl-prolyl cis-trans isomerase n=1 Tax=Pseudazoarcus pumilus TaxID=2067960 RepID=A0A2I6S650_9RHOO|nr:peptidylprolyl isomerase [Pseudazoarcus pumilus]AUN94747.1 peptidyl-prolyl cis-trans isomerase A [Pseudazoarcus pumilus]
MIRTLFACTFALASLAAAAANPVVDLETNRGTIRLELDAEKAPVTVENFVQYVRDGHYDGTVFHRVIDGFMIQGGGFDEKLKQKPTRAPIRNEADNGLKNATGTIAMARTNVPDSATSQFFINLVDNTGLDRPRPDGHGYAVFGRVVDGMGVVREIGKLPTRRAGPHQNVPVEPVVVERAVLVESN